MRGLVTNHYSTKPNKGQVKQTKNFTGGKNNGKRTQPRNSQGGDGRVLDPTLTVKNNKRHITLIKSRFWRQTNLKILLCYNNAV